MRDIFTDQKINLNKANYIFGETISDILEGDLKYIFSLAYTKRNNLVDVKIEDLLMVIDKVCSYWNDYSLYELVFKNLPDLGFSNKMIELAINELIKLFTYENMVKRINLEIGDIELLDSWKGDNIKLRVFPLGILVHITAGNVFVSAIDSLLNGVITKNLNIVKTSSKVGNFFAILWMELIKQAEKELKLEGIISNNVAIFSYRSEELLDYLNKYADGIVVWGSYDTVKYFRNNINPTKKLVDFGPKYSISVLDDQTVLENIDNPEFYNNLAWDICLWEQRACSSVQTIYIIGNLNKKIMKKFLKDLSESLNDFPIQQSELSFDEYTEIFKYEEISLAKTILEKGIYYPRVYWDFSLNEFFIGPLNRFVCIKNIPNIEDLVKHLGSYTEILQSCSVQVKDEKVMDYLSTCGITRFTKIGKIGFNEVLIPHEGEYILRRFSKLVSK